MGSRVSTMTDTPAHIAPDGKFLPHEGMNTANHFRDPDTGRVNAILRLLPVSSESLMLEELDLIRLEFPEHPVVSHPNSD